MTASGPRSRYYVDFDMHGGYAVLDHNRTPLDYIARTREPEDAQRICRLLNEDEKPRKEPA